MTESLTKTSIFSKLLKGVTAFTSFFSFLFAFGACSPFGAEIAISATAPVSVLETNVNLTFFDYLLMLIALCTAAQYGTSVAFASIVFAFIFFALLCRIKTDKAEKLIRTPVIAGLMISTAFSLTALQTTNYFGIGAEGANVIEMLISYRSLGFHANWRGVLYGTIVMVIMITFPRAFKKFSKIISPAFIALAVTLVLNLFLNPSSRPSAINEVGSFERIDLFSFSELALSDVPAILAAGAATAIIMYLSHVSRQGNVNQAEIKFKFALINILIATTIIFALEHSGILYRMPIHSLAVVIIVGAWQSVEWGKIGKSIKGGAASGIIMIISAAMPIFTGPSEAVLILLLLSAALAMHDRRKELSRS